MIDSFSLALSHGLLLLVAWRLLTRDDLDDDSLPPPPPPGDQDTRPGARLKASRRA